VAVLALVVWYVTCPVVTFSPASVILQPKLVNEPLTKPITSGVTVQRTKPTALTD